MSKKNIKYKIVFHTDWHCGSGLAAGAGVDALTIKDKNRLPFVPGKTIKGLVREAVEEILFIGDKMDDIKERKDNGESKHISNRELFVETFGNSKDQNIVEIKDAQTSIDSYQEAHKGKAFFTNATLQQKEYDTIIKNNAARFMYRTSASTAIDDSGIAVENSLRKTEVAIPCECYGEILNVPVAFEEEISNALKYIKRLGQGRNRGLGRCTIEITEVEKGGEK